jgi:hypothetical protein
MMGIKKGGFDRYWYAICDAAVKLRDTINSIRPRPSMDILTFDSWPLIYTPFLSNKGDSPVLSSVCINFLPQIKGSINTNPMSIELARLNAPYRQIPMGICWLLIQLGVPCHREPDIDAWIATHCYHPTRSPWYYWPSLLSVVCRYSVPLRSKGHKSTIEQLMNDSCDRSSYQSFIQLLMDNGAPIDSHRFYDPVLGHWGGILDTIIRCNLPDWLAEWYVEHGADPYDIDQPYHTHVDAKDTYNGWLRPPLKHDEDCKWRMSLIPGYLVEVAAHAQASPLLWHTHLVGFFARVSFH